MQHSDDPQPHGGEHDDDLVGPRRGGGFRRSEGGGAESGGAAASGGPWEPAEGDEDLIGPRRRSRFSLDDGAADEPPVRRAPVRSARTGGGDPAQVALSVVRELPSFLRLLMGLARDRRVSVVDKALVGVAVAYFFLPEDAIPDFAAPYVGQVDDVVVLGVALGRLLSNVGSEVLLDHWHGDMETLEQAMAVLDRASGALPGALRNLIGAR
ncbi:MAG TPA: DUF1232 domain-containing protein [Longimicrobium sp.]|nr:DUF1232 domain-containing protein [Longimicrobium sp.]